MTKLVITCICNNAAYEILEVELKRDITPEQWGMFKIALPIVLANAEKNAESGASMSDMNMFGVMKDANFEVIRGEANKDKDEPKEEKTDEPKE